MRKLLPTIACVFALTAFLCGCGLSPKSAAYKSLSSIAYTVDGAMKIEAAAYVAGKIPATNHARIAYIKDLEYNPSFALALNAATNNWSAPAPESLNKIVADLITLVDQFVHPKAKTP